jgi:glucokinase
MTERLYLGADLGGTHLRVGLRRAGAADGTLVATETLPADPTWDADALASIIEGWCSARRMAYDAVLAGAGIALTGDVDARSGMGRSMRRYPRLERAPISGTLTRWLNVPVRAANDGLVAALAELRAGAGQGLSDWVMLTLGTGIGGAIVIGGRLLLGDQGRAGKVGHQIIDLDGPVQCHCGRPGCWQSFVARDGILARARKLAQSAPGSALAVAFRAPGSPTVKDLARLAAGGDEPAQRVFAETGRAVGIGLANLVKILAPTQIVLGGGIARENPWLLAAAEETLREYAFEPWQVVPIVPARFGPEAGVVGATFLAEGGL